MTVVKATYVSLNWSRSPDDINGTMRYSVDCFRCKSSKDKECLEPCGPQVYYKPNRNNITSVTVTVHGLRSDSYFLFRVYSVNELNQQEKDRDKWKYAKVFVRTKGKLPCKHCACITCGEVSQRLSNLPSQCNSSFCSIKQL